MNVISPMAAAVLAALAFVAPATHAVDAAAERAERERINLERDQAEAAYKAREQQCRQRFVVTPCVDQARHDRRQTMERLREQQAVLDEVQRKQRAAQRIDDIRTKVSGGDAKQREAMAQQQRRVRQRAQAAASAAPEAAASDVAQAESAASLVATTPTRTVPARVNSSAEEAKHVADYERRQQEAKAHKEAVARRNAERAASGKTPAKGLPTPAGASVPQ